MITTVRNYIEENVIWRKCSDPVYPFEAEIEGERLVIRLNDFPDANLYTLLVNNQEVASFDDWPRQWSTE